MVTVKIMTCDDEKRCICLRLEKYVTDNIAELCKKRDISNYRLSQLSGISQSSLGRIIATGSRACNDQRIKKIRNSLKMIFWIVPFLCHLNNLKNKNMLDL